VGVNDESQAPAVSVWGGLTEVQRFVLIEAFEESRLIDVLNGWADPADAPYWNRKAKYVPALIEATSALLAQGLIEVWAESPGVGEGGLLPAGAAAEVVADPDNWWKYDPDENTTGAGAADTDADPTIVPYTLLATDAARASPT